MFTLIDEHPLGPKPVNGQDVTWGIYLAQVAPFRCDLVVGDQKKQYEQDAARRHRWARAMLHLLFPVKDATGFGPHPKENTPVYAREMIWRAQLVQACRLAPLDFTKARSEKEEVEMLLADAWQRVEWAKAMLHEFFPVPPPITPVPLEEGEGRCK